MLEMFEAVKDFLTDNLQTIAAFAAGAWAMALIWLAKHPEDFYTREEIDPDPEIDLDEMAR